MTLLIKWIIINMYYQDKKLIIIIIELLCKKRVQIMSIMLNYFNLKWIILMVDVKYTLLILVGKNFIYLLIGKRKKNHIRLG